MDAFLDYSRLMLVILCVFGAVEQSESKIDFNDQPEDPKIVVLGVNSSVVSLKWDFFSDAGETIQSVIFKRQKPGETQAEQIASRGPNDEFTMTAPFKDFKKYRANGKSELKIFNVQRDEEYVYTLALNYKTSSGVIVDKSYQVLVDVKVPPKITKVPTREPRLNIGEDKNLTCSASGDPRPNITWTKDGTPMNEFNVSGPVLQLVNVQRNNSGSYRCTASNGYGDDATSVSIVGIICSGSNCEATKVGITLIKEDTTVITWKSVYSNQASLEYRTLESKLLSAISSVYTKNQADKQLYRVDVVEFREGSVKAIVELLFGKSVANPLKPLEDAIRNGKLGSFTVDKSLDLNPTDPPSVTSTSLSTTAGTQETPDTGARTSGLTTSEMWGIIGGCIAFVLLIVIIILICCICKKKKSGGASKGGKSYTEADGYRMNRQPPPSGLGTASPAYVEARQYAPVTAARKQDDQSKPPLNYADLSFNNSSAPGRQPPRYTGTEYSEMSPEKRPPPAGGQQGEGGGFELWC
ncbi:hypothetical protein ACROYT_G028387 [Oculina patagonica]